jgi:hypothetical protein
MPPVPQTLVANTAAAFLLAGGLSTSAASLNYEISDSPDVSVTGDSSWSACIETRRHEIVEEALAWQDVVDTMTVNHRQMEQWEEKVTSDFVASLFE